MKKVYCLFIVCVLGGLTGGFLQAKDQSVQFIRALIYRMERVDSCLVLDMNVNLREVKLAPDCTVYLIPRIFSGSDSLDLPPIMLNGPQSDLMYRRRKALGKFIEPTPYEPYAVLRESGHELPVINYRKDDMEFQPWMEKAGIKIFYKSYNNDDRLIPIEAKFERVPPVIVVKTDTLILRDTIRIEKNIDRPVYVPAAPAPVVEKKKETVIEHAGYRADIYFPVSGMKILPEHDLNKEAWHVFVSELDSLRSGGSNTVMGITVIGYSSPEGNYEANDRIAKRRAEALKSFLETKYNSTLVEIRTEWIAEDWDRLAELVRASNMEDKDKVLDIIDNVDIFKGRENRLKSLSGGKAWAYMLKEYFPKLRCASCRIGYVKRTEK
ncbi:DUF3868 domain-containing protein [Bacteroides nordii]|uniref:DUF3868 domain-containing protein n=1 Tax=Bacteroides nordii TaxID=291645 RepID=A0A413VIH4_9BACE|nr:DUF3868 domain-containing protein [Bacteroides nordii]RHB33373.1 DUF3868 domain-containing protein [Bacteroides nordii]